ncbi:MAG: glycosyltransferase family 4 protein [Bacilli bacterium]
MKICLVHEEYPEETHYSGIATAQKIIAETLVKKGHDVTVIAKSLDCDKNYLDEGVKVIRLSDSEIDFRTKVSKLLSTLQKHGEIEIIEVPDKGAYTVLFEKSRKVPLVVRLQKPSIIWNKEDTKTIKWENKILEASDLIISSTNYLKEKINKPNKKIEIIRNPIDQEIFYLKNKKREKNKNIIYCGSLEESKGVLNLAKSIPDIVENLGNIKFIFVGEDTTKNNLGISTIEYIKNIVPKKLHKLLEFKGKLTNEKINILYNRSLIAVFPSLYDNLPYSVLECMASSVPFVGSINSGMMEAVKNTKYLSNEDNLTEKIIELYKNKEIQKEMSSSFLETIKNEYSKEIVVDKLIKVYKKTIEEYNYIIIKRLFKDEIKKEIKDIKKLETGLTNFVYLIQTNEKKYIVKIYKKIINENLFHEMIEVAKKSNFNLLNPLETKLFKIANSTICVYHYIEGKHQKKLSNTSLEKILEFIKAEKKVEIKGETMIEKVDFFYESLRNMKTHKIRRELIEELLKKYMKLKNYKIFQEKELIHGDLCYKNILWNESGDFTILDLDNICLFTKLYDLVVFAINMSKNEKEIDIKTAKKILKPFDNYTKVDIINVWNFYLLKVIFENIYLYEINKIDLREETNTTDSWEYYYELLNNNIIEDILNK